ncbi:unnamed protein product [Protopolystoma xenopodis]|uniref:Uncharacterized protein n=1 Tax=Protopolystoma xenopodis TaxID=117903 RepID=A0A448WU96_9PLAT|nr:unnamed protein product [Protopolystoma xenopodis]
MPGWVDEEATYASPTSFQDMQNHQSATFLRGLSALCQPTAGPIQQQRRQSLEVTGSSMSFSASTSESGHFSYPTNADFNAIAAVCPPRLRQFALPDQGMPDPSILGLESQIQVYPVSKVTADQDTLDSITAEENKTKKPSLDLIQSDLESEGETLIITSLCTPIVFVAVLVISYCSVLTTFRSEHTSSYKRIAASISSSSHQHT